MNQNITAVAQQCAEFIASNIPLPLKLFVRCRHIDDWQVEPQYASANHLLTKTWHPKQNQFFRLHQRDNGSRAPISDGVEIYRKIPIPISAQGMSVILSGTEGDANPSEVVSCRQRRNLQWMC